jgi:hypothetical protein
MNEPNQHGWCLRCGHPYENTFQPTCECAGDPPIGYFDNPLDPAFRKYLERAIRLRYASTGS